VALSEVFPPVRPARGLLREAGFPRTAWPGIIDTSIGFWEQISESLANGILAEGRHRIITAALGRYPEKKEFQRVGGLAAKHPPSVWRVLVIGAAPAGTGPIRPDRDAKAIETAAQRGHLDVRYRPAAAATDLKGVLEFRPDVVHLTCHGTGDNLVFEDVQGQEHLAAAADVADVLRRYSHAGRIQLLGLVLASCNSDVIAGHFVGVAAHVVAYRGPLDDLCAQVFTRHLYETLAHIQDVGEAALLAAAEARLTDSTCASMVSDLIVLSAADVG
jgi:hypothetical protein